MSNIGILGGSFDPFHNGHLSIAKAAMKECGLAQIVLLPAKVQPFKVGKEMADERHRVNMVNLIARKNQNFTVSTAEVEGEDVSYTYKTMRVLKESYPGDQLHFIMGTDSFLSLESWYRGTDLIREVDLIVGTRPGYRECEMMEKTRQLQNSYGARIKILHNKMMDISSTEIKENIKSGKSIRTLVPFEIERYIYEHRLYQGLH